MTRLKIPFAIMPSRASSPSLVGFNTSRQTTNATAAPQSAVVAPSAAAQLQSDFVNVYSEVAPSVVQIETGEGLGSGIVFDTKGHIVTNAHVVGTHELHRHDLEGRQFKGTLVGTFPADDLAVIKVAERGLPPATFADSSKVQVGAIAMAIGNPLGLSSA